MKKTTHLVLYAILFTCISILLINQFIPNKVDSRSTLTKNTFEKKEIAKESPLRLNIAYVNSDTVSKYYNYAKKLQKSLSTKRAEAEGQIKNKYSSYEVLVREFEKASPKPLIKT